LEYTSRLGERETQAHINYECPCGCTAGLTYDRETGAEHLGRCCCGRLLWVGEDAEARVRAAHEHGTAYEMDIGRVTLPWGVEVKAALAVPALLLRDSAARSASTLVRDVVCNMRIDPETAAGRSEFEGATYYFCAQVCKQRFDANPLQFLAAEA
jgi:YHS domain-containing protein